MSVYCLSWSAHAQQRLVFRHLTQQDQLATNQVLDIMKDSKGYMWFATGNGLQRYDGKRWMHFMHNPAAATSIPDNYVMKVYEDRKGRLWVFTRTGVAIMDRATFRCTPVPLRYSGSNSLFTVLSVVETADGKLWIGIRPGGLLVFNEQSGAFESYTTVLPRIQENIYRIVHDTINKRYWLATDSGLVVYDLRRNEYYYRTHNPQQLPLLNTILNRVQTVALYINRNNELWCSGWKHHFALDLKRNTLVFADSTSITGIRHYLTDANGDTWGSGMRLARVNRNKQRLEEVMKNPGKEYGIDFNTANALFEDPDNNLWLPTDKGVYVFNPKRQVVFEKGFTTYYSGQPKKFSTNGFIELNDGKIIALCWGGDGMYFFDSNLQQVAPPVRWHRTITDSTQLLTWCGLQDSRGTIWIGAQLGELYKLNPGDRAFTLVKDTSFEKKTIFSIAEDKDGNIWFGGRRQNIVKLQRSSNRLMIIQPSHSPNEGDGGVRKLLYDGKGYLWAGMIETGLMKINTISGAIEKRFINDCGDTGFPATTITDMAFTNDSTLILATDKGLLLMNTINEKTTLITTADGLPHNEIRSLTKDRKGLVWLSTPNGIASFNPTTRRIAQLDMTDGLTDGLYTEASAITLKSGHLLFGTYDGFISVTPEKQGPYPAPPNVTITGIRLFDNYLNLDSVLTRERVLELNYNQNYLTIEFSSMRILMGDKLTYYYKLEGLYDDWVKAGVDRLATFTYLPGGGYTFHVKAVASDGTETPGITSFSIRVKPPFWQSWWFYLLCAGVVSGIVYAISYTRKKRREETEKIRGRIARDLHDDMGSTLSTINILSEMAKNKINSDQVLTRGFIEQISQNSVQMMESMDDIVWSIDPSNDCMENIVSRMREFAGNLLEAKGISYTFEEDETAQYINLELGKRHDLFLLYKEAVNNLAKYSACTAATISIQVKRSRLHLHISDNGKGFNPDLITDGNGLTNMQKRAEALHGKISINTSPGNGTRIIFEMAV